MDNHLRCLCFFFNTHCVLVVFTFSIVNQNKQEEARGFYSHTVKFLFLIRQDDERIKNISRFFMFTSIQQKYFEIFHVCKRSITALPPFLLPTPIHTHWNLNFDSVIKSELMPSPGHLAIKFVAVSLSEISLHSLKHPPTAKNTIIEPIS